MDILVLFENSQGSGGSAENTDENMQEQECQTCGTVNRDVTWRVCEICRFNWRVMRAQLLFRGANRC